MMLTPLERVQNLLSDLRIQPIDFDAIYAGKNDLTPLDAVELFLQEELRLRVQKQTMLRYKKANLPAQKSIDTFDFGFQRSVSREQMLRLSDMTWVEQTYNICLLGPRALEKHIWPLLLQHRGLILGTQWYLKPCLTSWWS
jgi:DNA replication protein DnaC